MLLIELIAMRRTAKTRYDTVDTVDIHTYHMQSHAIRSTYIDRLMQQHSILMGSYPSQATDKLLQVVSIGIRTLAIYSYVNQPTRIII